MDCIGLDRSTIYSYVLLAKEGCNSLYMG
ncbi:MULTISPECIES: hypothetical protein [Shewanella]